MTRGATLAFPLFLLFGACSLIHYHPYHLGQKSGTTQANLKAEDRTPRNGQPKDGVFIGIALAGGGSRAANFGAAVLLQLRTLGILDRADFLSSVSGGSLAAIYYALEGYEYDSFFHLSSRTITFEQEELLDRLGANFQWHYAARWFYPWNVFLYWFTTFNRTEIMYDVFDADLYHGATFADLNTKGPKLLVNATERDDLEYFNLSDALKKPYGFADLAHPKFVFADERVAGADLNPLPLSVAATASSAVPGLFQDVTLPLEPTHRYLHLTDAMQTDNQGLLTLLGILQQAVKDGTYRQQFPQGCVLIAIDSAPNDHNWAREKDETRREWKDYLVDRNLAEAVDYILLSQREKILGFMGLSPEDVIGQVPIKNGFRIVPNLPNSPTCHFWHIALRYVPIVGPNGEELVWYPTEFDIDRSTQNFLYRAACLAMQRGWVAGAKDWFGRPGSPTIACPESGSSH